MEKRPRRTPAEKARAQYTNYAVKEPMELMEFLTAKMPDASRTKLKSLLSKRVVLVDNVITTQFNFPLKPGMKVQISKDKGRKEFNNRLLKIVYEDAYIIVVEKMQGLLSVNTERQKERTAYTILNEYVQRSGRQHRVYIVHRLDRDTSGLMMFAKDEKTQRTLRDNWHDIVTDRRYVAVVEGSMEKDYDTVVSWLTDKTLYVSSSGYDDGGSKSITHYRTIKRANGYSLVELDLETGRALRELSSVSAYDERVKEMEEQLTEIDNLLSDFNHELASYLSDEEFDEETFYETEKRLDLINHLKSKYGNTIADILKYGEEKAERITVLNDYDAYLAGLQKNVSEKEKQLEQLSRKVSDIRKKESKKLTESIKNALLDLNFLDVQFMMEFAETDYTANGIDDAQFLISTNPGEPVKPLGKVASGGELSRIMLAIKTVMASDKIGTLIFDEIDSGISGRTAQMVSEKMNALGRSHQIICITHLPQIAAMADSHFLIEKSVENQATVSKIHKLTDEESVEELARMLGGVEITDTVLENAREMKQMAYMKK